MAEPPDMAGRRKKRNGGRRVSEGGWKEDEKRERGDWVREMSLKELIFR